MKKKLILPVPCEVCNGYGVHDDECPKRPGAAPTPDPAALARVEAWMDEICPHVSRWTSDRKHDCPDCLLAFVAAQRAEATENLKTVLLDIKTELMNKRNPEEQLRLVSQWVSNALVASDARREGP